MLLGLDIGTSGVRASLFDEAGNEIPEAGVRRARTSSDLVIFDADAIVKLVIEAVDSLLMAPAARGAAIELISISCFWHSLLGIDQKGTPTTPLLGWAENRATDAARELRERLNENEIHQRTGCRLHPSYWPAKLLWLQRSFSDQFEATTHWLSFSEYLQLKLWDTSSISVSMASGTGLFDQKAVRWDDLLPDELSVPLDALPRISNNAISENTLRSEFASRWPQLRNARLAPAVGDGAANNIGAGCTSRNRLGLMIGTSGAARLLFQGEPPEELPLELWSYRADKSRVVIGGALSDGGGLVNRMRDHFLPDANPEALESELAAMEPDAQGLTILPFWAGERSTGWSLNARGGIFGLSNNTKPIEIVRATMEAIAYRFALILEALEPFAQNPTVVASGNALRSSRAWIQIIADVIGRPLALSGVREASMRGAALLALEAAGKIQHIETANDLDSEVEPQLSNYEKYQEALKRQQRLYRSVIG